MQTERVEGNQLQTLRNPPPDSAAENDRWGTLRSWYTSFQRLLSTSHEDGERLVDSNGTIAATIRPKLGVWTRQQLTQRTICSYRHNGVRSSWYWSCAVNHRGARWAWGLLLRSQSAALGQPHVHFANTKTSGTLWRNH